MLDLLLCLCRCAGGNSGEEVGVFCASRNADEEYCER